MKVPVQDSVKHLSPKEREQYLSYMLREGASKQRVRTIASMLLHVIRSMELSCLRVIDTAEIQQGSQRWLTDTSRRVRRPGASSVSSFTYTAKNWFRFHGLLKTQIATCFATSIGSMRPSQYGGRNAVEFNSSRFNLRSVRLSSGISSTVGRLAPVDICSRLSDRPTDRSRLRRYGRLLGQEWNV